MFYLPKKIILFICAVTLSACGSGDSSAGDDPIYQDNSITNTVTAIHISGSLPHDASVSGVGYDSDLNVLSTIDDKDTQNDTVFVLSFKADGTDLSDSSLSPQAPINFDMTIDEGEQGLIIQWLIESL